MRRAIVFYKGEPAGTLTEFDRNHYNFRYYSTWFEDDKKPAISLTLPKTKKEYECNHLFPVFYNMLSEGSNKELQCRRLQIDEQDDFGLLMATAHTDTIGAINIKRIEEGE